MVQPPPRLEMCNDVDGTPIPIDPGDDFTLGEYDIAVGKEVKMFIRNPSAHLVANIKNIDISEDHITFDGPSEIQPLQYVECRIKIHPRPDEFDIEEEEHFKLEGEVEWRKSITRADRL